MDILKALERELKHCNHCGGNEFQIVKTVNNGGGICYPYFCKSCYMRSPICETKKRAELIGFIE